MRTEVTYKDLNGKKVTRVFTSEEDLINKLGVEARNLNLKRKAAKDPIEKLLLIRAEIGLRKIIKLYSPESENRTRKNNPYEIR